MTDELSPFLAIPEAHHLASNRSAFAVADRFPVSRGHALVVPRRQVGSWWQTTALERADLLELVDHVKALIDERYSPDGYNVGFNSGAAAGQTVAHFHIHVIPRYSGDVADPRGGIRHVIQGRGNYLDPSLDRAWLVDGWQDFLKEELVRCFRDPRFDRIDVLVSFIMKSGLALIVGPLEDALARDARVRVLTTDYLQVTDADALTKLLDLVDGHGERLTVRIFHDDRTSFHPKSYIFWSSSEPVATGFVGSSNLSASGIDGGVEWNLGVTTVESMRTAFDRLWTDVRVVPLTHEWLRSYRQRPKPTNVVPLEIDFEPPAQPAEPRPTQREALDALELTRIEGHAAGLVVMATGLGKTWLAAFDSTRPAFDRVLFVAHREEILLQARNVFRQVRPEADFGLYTGDEKQPDAKAVFSSIQTLARNLDEFEPREFDYIVLDEFHHAAAASYRRVLAHFQPRFLLGLTATPDRMDGADLLALCGDNVVFVCDLVSGIRRDELSPFRYFGVRDVVDYAPIPWRNGRFDPATLTTAVETQERAEQAFVEWSARGQGRTLAFCVTVTHADFMASFFRSHGVKAVAVHSGPTSAGRSESIERLRAGDLDVVFAVDMFNEGLDVPEIDAVLMLRPTESPVVFLQQLGRGLRKAEGKPHLTVIDFIGNHRSFFLKPRTLLSLGSAKAPSTARVLQALRDRSFDLPPGCSVEYELGLVDMLAQLVRAQPKSALTEYCRSAVDEKGQRPTAIQAYRAGLNPAAARPQHNGWFGFLSDIDLLSEDEAEVYLRHGDVLDGLEVEPVTKSYKLLLLYALLQDRMLRTGAGVSRIAETSQRIVASDPRLVRDTATKELPDPASVPREQWRAYWRKWPIAAWAGELKGQPGRWFRMEGERLVPTFTVGDDVGDVFDEMVAEIVEYRLARYLLGKQQPDARIRCRVSQADGRPLIWLDRQTYPSLPEGKTALLAEDESYEANFVKIALNVMRRPGQRENALHGVLRRWFGRSAGAPGTNHSVVFKRVGTGWVMTPERLDATPDAAITPGRPNAGRGPSQERV